MSVADALAAAVNRRVGPGGGWRGARINLRAIYGPRGVLDALRGKRSELRCDNGSHTQAEVLPCRTECRMSLTRIDTYEVFYSANSFSPRIALKNAGTYIGQLVFLPNGSTLPADTSAKGVATLYYHLGHYQNAIDLLRNEKPMYLYYNGSGGGFENGIKTMVEKVGEGERGSLSEGT
jgi:hypothetical protein